MGDRLRMGACLLCSHYEYSATQVYISAIGIPYELIPSSLSGHTKIQLEPNSMANGEIDSARVLISCCFSMYKTIARLRATR
jgi:hypothetical protein